MILQIIDVLIGLTVVYLIFSTISSALFELVESLLKKRGVMLERGIGEIFSRIITAQGQVSDTNAKALLAEFYQSPHIFSLFRHAYTPGGSSLPSYIPAERFAGAVMTLAQNGTLKADFERIRNTVLAVSGADIGVIEQTAEARVAETRAQLIAYFDDSMERVSGWYARYARAWLLVIGLVLAALFNVDTLQLIRQLSQDDALRQSIVSQVLNSQDGITEPPASAGNPAIPEAGWSDARDTVERQLQIVDTLGLPIGWKRDDWKRVGDSLPTLAFKILGVLLTAIALSFGAPFWFNLLNQLGQIRTSLKPNRGAQDADPKNDARTQPESAPMTGPKTGADAVNDGDRSRDGG